MVEARSLTFAYEAGTSFHFPDIQVGAAESLLIIGRSGIGKTTLLHLLGGLLPPASGDIRIVGQALRQLRGTKLDKFRGRHVGIVFQRPHFVRALNLMENLQLAQRLARVPVDADHAKQVLHDLGLEGLEKKYPHKMSQGQQQRATIAMATVNDPEVLLADEPTSSLDDENCHRVIELLKHHSESLGAAMIVITHDRRLKEQFKNILEL